MMLRATALDPSYKNLNVIEKAARATVYSELRTEWNIFKLRLVSVIWMIQETIKADLGWLPSVFVFNILDQWPNLQSHIPQRHKFNLLKFGRYFFFLLFRASNITSRKEPAVWRGNWRSCVETDVYLGNQMIEDFSQNQVILSEVTRTKLKNQHRVSRPIKSGLDAWIYFLR